MDQKEFQRIQSIDEGTYKIVVERLYIVALVSVNYGAERFAPKFQVLVDEDLNQCLTL